MEQNFENRLFVGKSPEDVIDIALAHYDRIMWFRGLCDRAESELDGNPAEEPIGALERARFGGEYAQQFLSRAFEDQGLSVADYVDRLIPQSFIDGELGRLGYTGDDAVKHVTRMKDDITNLLWRFETRASVDGDHMPEEMVTMLEHAEAIAIHYGVDVVDVFNQDDFYHEFIRRSFSPEDYTDRQISSIRQVPERIRLDLIDGLNEDDCFRIFRKNIELEEARETLSQLETKQAIQIIGGDASIDALHNEQEAMRQVSLLEFLKVFGWEEWNRLNPELAAEIMHKKPLVSFVSVVAQSSPLNILFA